MRASRSDGVVMTGGRLAAGVLMMLAMVGAMVTFLSDTGVDRFEWRHPMVLAAIVGFMAGWSQLGRYLGRDFLQAGLFGVGAALIGLVFFAFLVGVRSAWITQTTIQFDTAIAVVSHVIDEGVRVVESATASRKTVAAFFFGALCTGVIAEFFNRIWR